MIPFYELGVRELEFLASDETQGVYMMFVVVVVVVVVVVYVMLCVMNTIFRSLPFFSYCLAWTIDDGPLRG